MKRSQTGEVRQASRTVTAARRRAVAKEKARIAGERATKPSPLGRAAMEREKELEAEARKAEERLGISRQVEPCPLSLQRVKLSPNATQAEDQAAWKPYGPRPERRTATSGRAEIAKVCTLSRRLIAIERARALGRKAVDHGAWALELEARRWAEERDGRN